MKYKKWYGLFIITLLLVCFSSIYAIIDGSIYDLDSSIIGVKSHYLDVFNLVVIIPIGIITTIFILKGSYRANLAGVSISAYFLYMFGFNSLSLGFNSLFLLYIGVFGLSIFTSVLGFIDLYKPGDRVRVNAGIKFSAIYLFIFGSIPTIAWLSEIITAISLGVVPPFNQELNIPVNVVHVFDLAFTLPLIIIAGIRLLKGQWGGIVTGIISVIFVLLICISILVMEVGLLKNSLNHDPGQFYSMFLLIPMGIVSLLLLLKEIKNEKIS